MITEGNRIKNKNSRKKRVIFPVLTILLVLGVVLYVLLREEEYVYTSGQPMEMDYSWVEDTHSVCHAFGGIGEYTYTNSLEAFELNYAAGHRVFEVDFMLTSDNIVVAGHDWNTFYQFTNRTLAEGQEATPLTLEEFQASRIFGQFTPLTWMDIAKLMQEYPDIYIVTDTKHVTDPMITDTFSQFVKEAKELESGLFHRIKSVVKGEDSILDRIIPQIYNNEMYDLIYTLYPWKSVIYTLYNQTVEEFTYENVYDFVSTRNIKVITTFPARADEEFLGKIHDLEGYVYLHTFNEAEKIEPLIEQYGIQGVYTDYLTPGLLAEYFTAER